MPWKLSNHSEILLVYTWYNFSIGNFPSCVLLITSPVLCVCACVCVYLHIVQYDSNILTRHPLSANLCIRCYMGPERIKPHPQRTQNIDFCVCHLAHITIFKRSLLWFMEVSWILFFRFSQILTMHISPHLNSVSRFRSSKNGFLLQSNPLVVIV